MQRFGVKNPPPNAQNHRVAASDVDFRFDPAGNSGAFFCSAFVLSWKVWPYAKNHPETLFNLL
jgi:hypothetical protein